MSRSHPVHVVTLAIGGRATVEAGAVPGGDTRESGFGCVGLGEDRRYRQYKGQGGARSDPHKILHCWGTILC
ncbi:hypothetical protein D3C72_2326240 [compost metagenome]